MKLIKYVLEHKAALVAIFLLFIAQSYFELMLPDYTAKIVDVGVQQSGIEDAVPDTLTATTYLAITSEDNQSAEIIKACYRPNDNGTFLLVNITDDQHAQLNDALAIELPRYYFGDNANPELYDQQAIEAVQLEYKALGISLLDKQTGYIWHIGLMMMLMVLGAVICHSVMNWFASLTSAQVARDLRNRFYRRILEFSDREIEQFSAASLITRGTNDVMLIQQVLITLIRMFFGSFTLAIGGIIMLSMTNANMAWIVVVAIAIIGVTVGILFKITWPKFKIIQSLVDRVNLRAREILSGMAVIRAFSRQGHEQNRFEEANDELTSTQIFTNRALAFLMPVMIFVMNMVAVAIVWFGGHFVESGTMQTGDMIASITYSMVIIASFLFLGMLFIILPRAEVAAARIDEVICTSGSIEDAIRVYDEDLAPTSGIEIAFNDVTFAYDDSSEPALEHITFTAKAGETTAIIGPTGCGKSTLLKLIERFFEVTEGSITIDGVDIRELSQHKLRSMLGYIPQEGFLFAGTIESNISLGLDEKEATEERIQKALDIAQASEFVSEKEDGLQATIAQKGSNVSGGQRQRLSIARALVTDAKALLFDDSFSALDYKTDSIVRAALRSELADKTVLIVAQRIATVMSADKIIFLSEGRLVASGTHYELMNSCEDYRMLALSQLSEVELMGGEQ